MPRDVEKWRETMIAKYGSLEAYKEYMREISSKGGKNTPKEERTFYKDRKLAKKANLKSQEAKK